jgi:hypothetical protein
MPDEAPDPSPTSPSATDPAKARISRRWFLAGGGAVLIGGSAGVLAGLRPDRPAPQRTPPPATLLAALEAERDLIANLDATTGGTPAVRRVIVAARRDHAAHLAALQALVPPSPAAPASATSSAPTGTARTAAQLRDAERAASSRAARRAATLHGAEAVLLASIAACEATHAELLA